MGAAPLIDARVLVVDDDPTAVIYLRRLLEGWGYHRIASTTDGADVLPAVRDDPPDLVLLDLGLPGRSGLEVLSELRPWTGGPANLPVIVITADVRNHIRQRALELGARDFLTKPFNALEARLRVANVLRTRELHLALERERDRLEAAVQERTTDLEQTQLEVLDRLARASEYRDDETQQHAQRVGRTSAMLASALGRPTEEVELLRHAAPLHDVGKVGVPDGVLLLPTRLDDRQYALMKAHTTIGHSLLGGSRAPVLQLAAEIALTHHERWDGHGYPRGLGGEDIPLPGRIVAVADVFDALVSVRPYKAAWSTEDAVAELRRSAGSQFDPAVIEAFDTLDPEALTAPVKTGTAEAGARSAA